MNGTTQNTTAGATTVDRNAQPLLRIDGLSVDFSTEHGWVNVVNDVSFDLPHGAIVGLVGESGSGKSVTCQSILQLIPQPPGRITSGRIEFEGRDLLSLTPRQLRSVRGAEIAMIFQEPMTSLNPAFTIGNQIVEVVRRHKGADRKTARARAIEVLDLVGIPRAADRLDQYPHEFSGGMRQRAMIAMALAAEPKLLIADEPTTALDVTIQAQVLELIRGLAKDLDMGVLFVTHDLGVVADVCDQVVVMYGGQVFESASTAEIFEKPAHLYTEALLRSRPSIEEVVDLQVIPGAPPLPFEMPPGCRFAPRCTEYEAQCDEPVQLLQVAPERMSRCVRGPLMIAGGNR
ncbi:ABC transporter ATP-binding protein [Nocardioides sp. Bht2]|uniref:ABC transporter ATP-binding protein n=1 Tax=Nocardioides sp. Bht2 TaxID=3392297 RepID=UPI0039B5790D